MIVQQCALYYVCYSPFCFQKITKSWTVFLVNRSSKHQSVCGSLGPGVFNLTFLFGLLVFTQLNGLFTYASCHRVWATIFKKAKKDDSGVCMFEKTFPWHKELISLPAHMLLLIRAYRIILHSVWHFSLYKAAIFGCFLPPPPVFSLFLVLSDKMSSNAISFEDLSFPFVGAYTYSVLLFTYL